MFWEVRRHWPGCPEFSAEHFGELGVGYVVEALTSGRENQRRERHEFEVPIANLTTLTANLNRDTKRQRQPYKLLDFCFFAPDEGENSPDKLAANAYMKLVEDKRLPSWALWVFSSMKHGDASRAPALPALIGTGVILLNPEERNGGVEGLLLACKEVSGQTVTLFGDGRKRCRVSLPTFEEATTRLAREGVYLPEV